MDSEFKMIIRQGFTTEALLFYHSKPIHARDFKENGYNNQYRYKKTSIIQELSTIQFNEKELNEKIRNWFEGTPERVGLVLGKVLEIMTERDYSAFQLFKSIMASKSKTKLKLINYEDEKNFYPQFWNTICFQKDAVKIEGLKLLGFLTSEYIHNISQQTQIDCIKNLKSLSSLHNNSFNVIRLALNCIGNILTHSKYKIVDENQEIFYNLYEILKNFTTNQKLEDHNNIRTLAALLRVLNCLHLDFKTFPQSVCELLVTQLNKYLYLGTSFYSFSGSSSYIHHDSSLETIISTSSSEISETEENEDKRKKEEVYSKIRNYCAACLSNVLRQNNKLIPQYLAVLLPSRPLSKELAALLQSMEEPLLITPLDYSEKAKKKQVYWEEVKEDFNEASLLNLLLFEENSKVRLSVCKTIAAILDGYYDKSLFVANEGNQANLNQIYQVFKNLASGVILSLFIEDDEMIFNHLLRLTSTMVAHYSYEKIAGSSLQILVKNILSKITVEYQYHTIFLNCISCFSALANGNFRETGFEELAINPNFNIVKILFKTIRDSMDNLLNNKESKLWKQDGIAESTILLESIIALLKFPKHYVEYIIENSESLIYILDKLQSFDKKFVNVIFKLVEETMKYITNNKADAEGDNEGFEMKDDTPKSNNNNNSNTRPQLHQNLENKIRFFHTSLEKLFRQIVHNPNNENIEFVLNILYYLEEDHWNLYYTETKKKLLTQIFRLNNIQALKQALLRLLGKICVFNTFIQTENFHSVIYNVLTLNYPEKNNNVMIKNSWVLANLCANLKNFQVFTVEQNQDILLMILGYCGSSKEKLVSNGFRALGYFISNNYDEMLCQILTYKNSKAKEVITALSEIYLKPFDSYSVKVCWNVCVSLSNIFKSYKPNFMKLFFKDPVLRNIAKILTTKNNFKTQIHCIEMLALAYEKYPENECFASLPKDLATIYFLADDQEFDQSELRYLPHLKESAKNLLLKLLDSNVFNKDLKNLVEILNANPHKFLQIFYENIRILYNIATNQPSHDLPDQMNSQETVTVRQRRLQSVDKLSIPLQQLNRNEGRDLKEFLDKISKLSQKFVNLVDASEDISVSFAVYEGLEQLAGIDLAAEDRITNFFSKELQSETSIFASSGVLQQLKLQSIKYKKYIEKRESESKTSTLRSQFNNIKGKQGKI